MSESILEAVKTTEEKPYTLRALEAKDLFVMSKIIGAIGINEFKDCAQADSVKALMDGDEKNVNDMVDLVGFAVFLEAANIIVNHLPACEKDIYTFLSNLSGMDRNQIETLPMNTFLEMIIDVLKKDEFKDFIKVVSKSFK